MFIMNFTFKIIKFLPAISDLLTTYMNVLNKAVTNNYAIFLNHMRAMCVQ